MAFSRLACPRAGVLLLLCCCCVSFPPFPFFLADGQRWVVMHACEPWVQFDTQTRWRGTFDPVIDGSIDPHRPLLNTFNRFTIRMARRSRWP